MSGNIDKSKIEDSYKNNPYWDEHDKYHPIDKDEIELLVLECYQIVFTSTIAPWTRREDGEDYEGWAYPSIEEVRQSYSEKLLSKKLFRLAILIRTYDDLLITAYPDQNYKKHKNEIENKLDVGVSNLKLDLANPYKKIGIRECCNKIIHAGDFRPVYHRDYDCGDVWRMNGELELKGEKNDKKWSATINIIEMLEAIVDLVKFEDGLHN